MLLQTNSYIVPKDKRAEHARLMARFRQCFRRLGSAFEVYEQTGPNFTGDGGGRFVQMMRFRDRRHQQEIQASEKQDKVAQQLIEEFCRLVNLPYQQKQGLFASGFYASVVQERPDPQPAAPGDTPPAPPDPSVPPADPSVPPGGAEADSAQEAELLEGVLEDESVESDQSVR